MFQLHVSLMLKMATFSHVCKYRVNIYVSSKNFKALKTERFLRVCIYKITYIQKFTNVKINTCIYV